MENWRTITELNPKILIYQISDHGNVRSINYKTGKTMLIKPSVTGRGYLQVGLMSNNNRYYFRVHRLVGKYFIPKARCKPQINHKDCNKTNNFVENLEWVTRNQNIKHAIVNGKIPIGENKPNAILMNAQVIEMRKRFYNGERICDIAKSININRKVAANAIMRRRYKKVV